MAAQTVTQGTIQFQGHAHSAWLLSITVWSALATRPALPALEAIPLLADAPPAIHTITWTKPMDALCAHRFSLIVWTAAMLRPALYVWMDFYYRPTVQLALQATISTQVFALSAQLSSRVVTNAIMMERCVLNAWLGLLYRMEAVLTVTQDSSTATEYAFNAPQL